jgi:hypothetical protein
MPDEITNVGDVVVPEIFLPYMIQRSTELTAFVQSGVIERSAEFDRLASGGGTMINMPFWQALSGEDQNLSSTAGLVSKKITASRDVGKKVMRGDMWAAHDLAGLLAGDDPITAIGDLVAQYWAEKTQQTTLALLRGIFASATMASNVHHIHHTTGGAGSATAANKFNGVTFIDAQQALGDHKKFLTAIAIHSEVESALRKQDLIDDIPDSEGKATIPTFQGLRVIVDDGMEKVTVDGDAVYTTYLFGTGALAMGMDSFNPPIETGTGTWQLEWSRDAANHVTNLINRRRFILHPRGVKWNEAVIDGESPTNAELATAANWTRVFDPKNVRIVQFKHNI